MAGSLTMKILSVKIKFAFDQNLAKAVKYLSLRNLGYNIMLLANNQCLQKILSML